MLELKGKRASWCHTTKHKSSQPIEAAGYFYWLEWDRYCAWKWKVLIPLWTQMTWFSWDPAAMTSIHPLHTPSKWIPIHNDTFSPTIQGKTRLFYETEENVFLDFLYSIQYLPLYCYTLTLTVVVLGLNFQIFWSLFTQYLSILYTMLIHSKIPETLEVHNCFPCKDSQVE